jgi:type IV secretory pathway VirB4 component
MIKKQTAPIKSTTQEFIEIKEIDNDIVLLKDGSCVTVIETSAINFSLLSEEEQDSLIYAYGSLLNSLSFAIQIVIASNRMNISDYLSYLDKKLEKQTSNITKDWLIKYMEFIKSIVTQNTVLKKRFFLVISFSTLELGAKGAVSSSYSSEYIMQRAKTALYPKKDHLLRLLARVGLRSQTLSKTELVNFFYNLYNPSSTGADLVDAGMFESYLIHGE